MIHAAIMPIALPGSLLSTSQAHHQVAPVDNSVRHCDDVAGNVSNSNINSNINSNGKQPCHGDSYQCCLGLVVISPLVALAPQI